MNGKNENIRIEKFLRIFINRWYVTLISIVLCLVLAVLYISFFKSDVYVASTTLYVIEDLSEKATTASETTVLTANEKLANDYKIIALSNRVLNKVRHELPEAILGPGNVSVEAYPESRILNLSVADADPEMAAIEANAITDVLIEEINDIIGKDNIKIIDYADSPGRLVSFNMKAVLAIFVLLGIILGLVMSVIIEITDTKVKGPADIEERFDLPIIGLIPKHKFYQDDIGRKEQK